MDENDLIFLSYSSPDRDRVAEFFDYLSSTGLNVWFDKRRLKGGQNWDFEIGRALEKAAIIVVFLSANSVDRRGYAQREIKVALDQARDKLIDDIYLIPVMLDAGTAIPRQLRDIQVIDATEVDGRQELVESIGLQLERLGAETARVQESAQIRWSLASYRDSWDGLPGYETSYQLVRLTSEIYPQISEISDIVKGWLVSEAMRERDVKFAQSTEHCNFGHDRFRRQNSWDASCGEPKVQGRIVSILYSVWWYGAGAAHPNQFFRSFNFTLDPLTQLNSLQDLFEDSKAALHLIQEESRQSLLALSFDGMTGDGSAISLMQDHVVDGTKDWDSFGNFAFHENGLDLFFSPYQVAPYAFGPQFVTIPYQKVVRHLREHFSCALDIDHLRHVDPDTFVLPAANDPDKSTADGSASEPITSARPA